jgi:hypothetical protein
VAGGQQIEVIQRHFIGGVVQSGNEQGVRLDHHAARQQAFAHLHVVEQGGQHASIHFTGLPAAGAAVQACCMRVVRTLAAVSGQQNQARLSHR